MDSLLALRTVRVAHTLAWALFAGCIVAIPYFAWRRKLEVAGALIAVVALEVAILLANHMRCPLTAIAARFTRDRRDNFDIYLPLWLAATHKRIFGTLFVGGLVVAATRWLGW